MNQSDSAYFGTAAQQTLLKRGRALYDLIGDDARFTYYGRTVGINADEDAPLSQLVNLARLQGNSNYANLRAAPADEMAANLAAQGLSPLLYARWENTPETPERTAEILASHPLPGGLTLHQMDQDTQGDLIARFAETALLCGVLPPATAALAGEVKPAVTLFATDSDGTVVSCAAACAFLSPSHRDYRRSCWWGMLSTHPDHRGARLSLILGAMVLERMSTQLGFTSFFTGVEPGNAPSEAVCSKLAFVDTGRRILGVADPDSLPGGRMTK